MADDWQTTRETWNKSGRCAREACGNAHDGCKHSHSALLYCVVCARRINEANPEVPGLVQIPSPEEIRQLRLDRRAARAEGGAS